tara:strand:+ start:110 stop:475 length:366 start_codon:yes stop_codon:yes gene_type:complete
MEEEDFVCYTKNNKVSSVGMNLNNIIAKHYYDDKATQKGGFRTNLTLPLPLILLNHENSFLKKRILNTNKIGGSKKEKIKVIDNSLFEKLIDLKSNFNLRKTRKHKKGGRRKKKTKKLFIF